MRQSSRREAREQGRSEGKAQKIRPSVVIMLLAAHFLESKVARQQ